LTYYVGVGFLAIYGIFDEDAGVDIHGLFIEGRRSSFFLALLSTGSNGGKPGTDRTGDEGDRGNARHR
jgi:hypothetical protein